jgi:Domain of unknown function (DUF1707)
MGELQPRMRAGDKDRQRVVEQLGKHFGEGRLTVEEFDERVVRAHAAVYLDQLPPLTADLPVEPAARPRRPRPRSSVPPVAALLLVVLLLWGLAVAVLEGAPVLLMLLLVFLVLRHRRWSRRW